MAVGIASIGRRVGRAVAVAAAAMVVLAPTAVADVGILATVNQPGSPSYASSNGTWVEVCDMEQDGNRVYGVFDTDTGTQRIYDSSGGGCGNATFGRVIRFKVCEDQPVSADPCSSIVEP
ncbi:hypothetical protein [Kibdelosporangium aridum]|uniref:hypothetical protein n=1 Tax=Kibdelosporangium aridum TaxID=2030 RepID=UPI0005256249